MKVFCEEQPEKSTKQSVFDFVQQNNTNKKDLPFCCFNNFWLLETREKRGGVVEGCVGQIQTQTTQMMSV